SRNQARIFEQEGQFFVEDLASSNGTVLNGKVLSSVTREVKSADKIGIGDCLFVFKAIEMTRVAEPLQDHDERPEIKTDEQLQLAPKTDLLPELPKDRNAQTEDGDTQPRARPLAVDPERSLSGARSSKK